MTDRKTILIVDDTPDNISLLSELLRESYRVKVATKGQKALTIASSQNPPDLILLDVMMPEMDGHEVCRRLKASDTTRDIPVIFLTAMSQIEDEQKGLEMGAVDYITKPISPPILITRVNTHLRLKEASDLLKNQAEILEKQVKERTQQLSVLNTSLARFVPDEFLRVLHKKNINEVNLGDHISKEMAVLFSDVRAFTTLSETMTPKQNFDFVNTYFSKVSPGVREHGGMIVKYLGDGMMAVFPHSPDDAMQAGIDILKRVTAYNRDRQHSGKTAIRVGVGIHLGQMMVGIVGESHRMQGDAFSDNVNLTSRIEGITKQYGISLIISEDIYNRIDPSQHHVRFLDHVVLKGRSHPIALYEVYDADPEELLTRKVKTKSLFEKGQQHYFAKEFAEAVKSFTDVLTVLPDDITTRQYLQRSSTCLLEGVPDNWQGVQAMSQK